MPKRVLEQTSGVTTRSRSSSSNRRPQVASKKKPKLSKKPSKKSSRAKKSLPQSSKIEPIETMADKVIRVVRQTYSLHANQNTALGMKKYMRNQFEFFGLTTPVRRKITKSMIEENSFFNKPSQEDLDAIVRACWAQPEREFQYFAQEFVKPNLAALTPDFSETILHCITTKGWWDTVDFISPHLMGGMARRHSEITDLLGAWIDHENLWVRRTALIYQLLYKNETDEKRLFEFCLKRAHEEEFFIRKAIGWALRQHARTGPKAVRAFVLENQSTLKPLSVKEAMKHLKK